MHDAYRFPLEDASIPLAMVVAVPIEVVAVAVGMITCVCQVPGPHWRSWPAPWYGRHQHTP
jgi:hypothetical protein